MRHLMFCALSREVLFCSVPLCPLPFCLVRDRYPSQCMFVFSGASYINHTSYTNILRQVSRYQGIKRLASRFLSFVLTRPHTRSRPSSSFSYSASPYTAFSLDNVIVYCQSPKTQRLPLSSPSSSRSRSSSCSR